MATYVVSPRELGLGVHRFIRPPIGGLAVAGAGQYDMPSLERSGKKADFSPPQKAESWRIRVRKFFTGKRDKRQTVHGDISYESHKSPARVARSQSWAAREAEKAAAEKGRAASASFNERSPQWETQEPSAVGQASELVRLTLRPKGSVLDVEVHQVTLRRRVEGFGLHLSAGLPPITVTFVEPGGEAEQAGVCVGDLVMEVNGYDCLQAHDVTRLLELKMLIQQVETTEARSNSSSGLNDDIIVDNNTWKEIKARQTQDDNESLKSSDVELTLIDDVSHDSDEVSVSASVQIPKGDKLVKSENTATDSVMKAQKSSAIRPKKRGGKKRRKKRVNNKLSSNGPSSVASGDRKNVSGGSNVQLSNEDSGTKLLNAEDDGETAAVFDSEDIDDGSQLRSSEDGGIMLHDSESSENKAQSTLHSGDGLQITHEYNGSDQLDVKKHLCGQERVDGVAVHQTGDFNRPAAEESTEAVSQLLAIDLSNVAWTGPSLGLREGRARRELQGRRLSKRHPATQQLPLLRGQDESHKLTMASVTLVGDHWTPAASDSRDDKSLGKLVHPLGGRSGSESKTSTVGELPGSPASTERGVPEWVTAAQVKAKRANSLSDDNSSANLSPSSEGRHSGNTCLPRQGHVAEKLAFFKSL